MNVAPWTILLVLLLIPQDPALAPAWTAAFPNRLAGPVLVEGDLVVAADLKGIVRGLAVETGEKKWEYDAGGPVAAMAVARQKIVIPQANGKVVFVDAATGRKQREFDAWAGAVPWAGKDRVYLGGRLERKETTNAIGASDRILCLNTVKWRVEWAADVKGAGPAAESGDRVYAQGPGGVIVCLDAKTGKPVWTSADRTGMVGYHPPLILKDRVVASGFGEGRMLCVDAKTGKKLWTWEPSGALEAGQVTPVLWEGKILVTALPGAALVDPSNGKPVWTADLGGHTMLCPAPAHLQSGKAWFAYAGMVASVDLAGGKTVDLITVDREAQTWSTCTPTWGGGRLFIGMDSTLHALEPR